MFSKKYWGRNNLYYASTCSHLADYYLGQTEYQKALPLALEALQIHEDLPDVTITMLTTNYNTLGTIYLYLSKFQIARRILFKSKANRCQELRQKPSSIQTILQ